MIERGFSQCSFEDRKPAVTETKQSHVKEQIHQHSKRRTLAASRSKCAQKSLDIGGPLHRWDLQKEVNGNAESVGYKKRFRQRFQRSNSFSTSLPRVEATLGWN